MNYNLNIEKASPQIMAREEIAEYRRKMQAYAGKYLRIWNILIPMFFLYLS